MKSRIDVTIEIAKKKVYLAIFTLVMYLFWSSHSDYRLFSVRPIVIHMITSLGSCCALSTKLKDFINEENEENSSASELFCWELWFKTLLIGCFFFFFFFFFFLRPRSHLKKSKGCTSFISHPKSGKKPKYLLFRASLRKYVFKCVKYIVFKIIK